MHSTDDVHARGAAMVARALGDGRHAGMVRCARPAIGAEPPPANDALFRALWSEARNHQRDSVHRAIRNLRALNQSDAALARVFDEA